MEDIKVGEKIRCNDGLVGELIRIERDDIDTSLKWYVFDDGKNERYVNKPYITKHSFNLIDLLEVGDYVNGEKIIEIQVPEIEIISPDNYTPDDQITVCIFKCGKGAYYRHIKEDEIINILTHQQFEANCYKVK